MFFSLAAILNVALCASAVNGVALPKRQATADPGPNANIPPSTTTDMTGQVAADGTFTVKAAPDTQADQALQKRVAPLVVAAGITAVSGAIVLTKLAIEVGADAIKDLGEWNEVRLHAF